MKRLCKPKRATAAKLITARDDLIVKLERAPSSSELAAALDLSPQRVRQILAYLDLPPVPKKSREPVRVDLTQPIPPERDELEIRLLLNLRRLYKLELEGAARSDGELGLAAGYKGRHDQAAAEFRKVFTGQRAPTIDICRKMARAYDKDPSEIWQPIEDST